jgi:murein DD-endopeptidase MepM/ murein hydrolase activator NlpD
MLLLPLLLLGCEDAAGTADSGDDTLRAALQLRFPLVDEGAFVQTIGVDHDPTEYSGVETVICADYLGRAFPHCYDQHDGSDYILDGGFDAMDAGSQPIVAAADGVVVDLADGNYDRCHGSATGGTADCDGHPVVGNQVTLEHATGHRTLYWHMMKDSVAVALGDAVAMGDTLGLVGSSGNSSLPHLHFALQEADGTVVDPYAGPHSQPGTYWCQQNGEDDFPGLCE